MQPLSTSFFVRSNNYVILDEVKHLCVLFINLLFYIQFFFSIHQQELFFLFFHTLIWIICTHTQKNTCLSFNPFLSHFKSNLCEEFVYFEGLCKKIPFKHELTNFKAINFHTQKYWFVINWNSIVIYSKYQSVVLV